VRVSRFNVALLSAGFLTVLSLMSCTFHSNQLELLKGLVTQSSEGIQLSQWELEWRSKSTAMYLVSENGEFVFTDGKKVAIWFDGWNIHRVDDLSGLSPTIVVQHYLRLKNADHEPNWVLKNRQTVDNRGSGSRLRLQIAHCAEWGKTLARSLVVFNQACSLARGDKYLNRIMLDDKGMIKHIETKILGIKDPNGLETLVLRKL
jgi:hypothetical protein